ncbi:hypothetical protein MCOR27_000538 [Pyricularia oryzae]|uniref:Uncharacterized protein n=1 Tax=Pyricularia grisea TaxID=148305 RepID=A0ABQ8NYS4_PYRGI|nr:hypothetical protein MCOR01_010218 [Pyricularia oryzae]KAI6304079.1 hypothetical protein MCOR33_000825 [Pyricularia grisea]KAI6279904.1 hypothetical protein MCOR26_004035 [Pyricularia oryzae]KAI6288968.1 hypothetical protein MCOR27_000538 [Pyricularia oryzae]KAI6344170.1 hypothetical protein MCOR28_004408 [Pyricularia oryzae]
MCGWHAPARHLFYCLKGSEGKELENKYPVVLSLHPPSASPQIALHVLLPSESDQMLKLYHNGQLQPMRDISVEFLLSFCMVSLDWFDRRLHAMKSKYGTKIKVFPK